jgi:hypothetical protein
MRGIETQFLLGQDERMEGNMFDVSTRSEYQDQIRRLFQSQFPVSSVKGSGDVLELVTDAIISTGKVRLGPKPSIESLYAIRQHVAAMIAAGEPIRFLMPWGSEKPGHLETVDMAEVGAMKTLLCLQKRVQEVYSPGIRVRIRIEDATAPSLFYNDQEQARTDTRIYVPSLVALICILEMDSFVQPIPESEMVTERDFQTEFDKLYPAMRQYIQDSQGHSNPESLDSYLNLLGLGWMGVIPAEQREHYLNTYRRLYGVGDDEGLILLARYLTQSLARKRLNMLGNLDWKDYLGLSFVGPVPGEPKNRTGKRIYYRTLSTDISSFHMAPWRSKGYLSISNDSVRIRLAGWNEQRDYRQESVTLRNGSLTTTVKCDYEIV